MLSLSDVAKHNSKKSCWIVVAGQVYDVTDFVADHPGGPGVILRFAGKDATKEYEPIHPEGTIEKSLSKDKHLGPVIPGPGWVEQREIDNKRSDPQTPNVLPLSVCQTLADLRNVAFKKLPTRARIYYESGAESQSAVNANHAQWGKVRFRPRMLRNVANVSMKCRIMGVESSLPIFVAPAAMAGLGHPDGELCLARGAGRMGIPQCVSTYSSVAPDKIMASWTDDPGRRGGGPIFQLYIPKKKREAEKLVLKAKTLGYQALVITVDTPVVGKRDEDDRFKALLDHEAGVPSNDSELPPLPGEEGNPLRGVHCSNFEWSDLPWIRSLWGKKPIILKGIQTVEDAVQATQFDIDGIYLSNHGGRQLDYAPSSLETLLEIRTTHPEVLRKVEIYLDGGVSRGSDAVKALCLGARAVGLGRGFMYALSAYGTEGVIKAIQALSDEIQTTMRLLGVTELSQLNEGLINTVLLSKDITQAKL